MTITIVSWNLARRQAAWSYLADELGADVALVQEAGPAPDGWHVVGAADSGSGRPWRAAVVSPRHELNEVTQVREQRVPGPNTFVSSVPGAAATATTTISGQDLTLTSLYGLMHPRMAYSSMNRHLADLAPLLESPDHYRRVIIGGDFNLTSQWTGENADYAAIDKAILDQFRAWRLRDMVAESAEGPLAGCPCIDGPDCRHVQTWFAKGPGNFPRQNDYLFVDKKLRRRATLRVDTEPVTWGLSDHAALVLTIDA